MSTVSKFDEEKRNCGSLVLPWTLLLSSYAHCCKALVLVPRSIQRPDWQVLNPTSKIVALEVESPAQAGHHVSISHNKYKNPLVLDFQIFRFSHLSVLQHPRGVSSHPLSREDWESKSGVLREKSFLRPSILLKMVWIRLPSLADSKQFSSR